MQQQGFLGTLLCFAIKMRQQNYSCTAVPAAESGQRPWQRRPFRPPAAQNVAKNRTNEHQQYHNNNTGSSQENAIRQSWTRYTPVHAALWRKRRASPHGQTSEQGRSRPARFPRDTLAAAGACHAAYSAQRCQPGQFGTASTRLCPSRWHDLLHGELHGGCDLAPRHEGVSGGEPSSAL